MVNEIPRFRNVPANRSNMAWTRLSETFNNGEEGEVFLAAAYNIVMSLWLHFQQTHIFYQFILPAMEWILKKKKKFNEFQTWQKFMTLHSLTRSIILHGVVTSSGFNFEWHWEWSWGITSTKFLQYCMNISNLVFSLACKLFCSCVWSCTYPFWARGVWILDEIVKKKIQEEIFRCIK